MRKAALLASSALLRTFPTVTPICELWVRCALPLIRDPEASVQDAVIEHTIALLLDKASAAAGLAKIYSSGIAVPAAAGRGRRPPAAGDGSAAAATLAAAAAARCLLSALAAQGRGAASCMAKLFGLLLAKKLLAAKALAKGLEALLSLGGARGQLTATTANPASQSAPAGTADVDDSMQEDGSSPTAAAAAAAAAVPAAKVLTRDEALGCWMLLREVAVVDPAAPSWAFLQSAWGSLQAQRRTGSRSGASAAVRDSESGEEEAALLWVVSHSALKVPPGEAERLARSLLQVGNHLNDHTVVISCHLLSRGDWVEVCDSSGMPQNFEFTVHSLSED